MADRDGFRVALKPSATAANEPAAALAAERGETVRFDSRADAEAAAADLAERGEVPVAIQAAAPQEPADVDAYLVASPERHTHEPDGSADGRLTFQTTAAQYGAIGETLVCGYAANPPLLSAYARRDLGDELPGGRDRPWVDVDRDAEPVVYRGPDGRRLAWVPDCVARAREGPGGRVRRAYYCEVKTGDASFQRDQATVMAYEAREAAVLKVRVDVDGLPETYAARVDPVEAETPPPGFTRRAEPDARLDDFA